MPIKTYFISLKERLILSRKISSFEILDECLEHSYGFIRVKGKTPDGKVFEAFEYVIEKGNKLNFESYSFHLQDKDGQLIRRWDNAPHHKEITTFPFHLHEGDKVIPSRAVNFSEFINYLEKEA